MKNRSSRPENFYKKGVLRNFTKLTGEHLCQGLFFNKVAGLRPATRLEKRLWHRCFPVNFVKFLRTPFLKEHLWWLLLYSLYIDYPLSRISLSISNNMFGPLKFCLRTRHSLSLFRTSLSRTFPYIKQIS